MRRAFHWRAGVSPVLPEPRHSLIVVAYPGLLSPCSQVAGTPFSFARCHFFLPHPSFRDDGQLRADWNTWLPQIRPHVAPDAAVMPDSTPYSGSTFKKADLADIPHTIFRSECRSGWGPATWRGGRRRPRSL